MSAYRLKKIGSYMINLDQGIGSGSYGQVYKGHRQPDKLKCAIKAIDKRRINGNKYLQQSLMREIDILQSINSENVVKMIEVLESHNNYYIIQELCDSDLDKFITQQKCSQATAINILSEIVNGFTVLVKEGIIHRDLKPANILMKDGQIKIADFGFAKNNICQKMKVGSYIGTPLYMAPQVLKGEQYSSKCDVWGLGFIFYELLHKRTPWQGANTIGLLKNIENKPLVIDEKVSPLSADFLRRTLEYEEKDRLSWDQVFSHPIFHEMFDYLKVNQQQIENKLKMLMTALRQEIDRKNIDVRLLLNTLQLEDHLNLAQFSKFINSICDYIKPEEVRYIFDLLDADCSGTVEIEEIEKEMKKNSIKLKRVDSLPYDPVTVDSPRQKVFTQVFREMKEALQQNGKSLVQYFYGVSQNSQSINFHNFKKMMGMFGDFKPEVLQDVFRQIDRDSSNTIEYDEIKLAFCQVNNIPLEAYRKD